MKKPILTVLFSLFLVMGMGSLLHPADAQSPPDLREKYQTPPDEIADEVMAPRHKNVTLSNLDPSSEYFITELGGEPASLSSFAKKYYNLGGLQFNPEANRSRNFTTQSTDGLEIIGAHSGDSHEIETPEGATITSAKWSPDGSKVAFFAHFDDATHIYVADTENGEAEQITDQPVLATLNTDFEWNADGNYIYTVLIPEDRGTEPQEPETPNSLQVKKTTENENRLRTYQDLLRGDFEAELLEYYVTGQFARIHTGNHDVKYIGEPTMIRDIDVSPDGEHAIVQRLQEPFSYIVPVYNFGWVEEVWNLDGDVLTELRKSKVRESVPDEDETKDYGRRNIEWRPDGEGLSLLVKEGEGLDEEDDDNGEEDENDSSEEDKNETDRVIQWEAPFEEAGMDTVYESDSEMESVDYASDGEMLFITQEKDDEKHLFGVYPDDPEETYPIYSHKEDDFYEDPGNLMTKPGEMGPDVVQLSSDQKSVYLSGTEYSEEYEENAPRPFIDQVTIESGEKERVFQSADDVYEDVDAVLDDDIEQIVISRESPETHPDSWLYNTDTEDKTKLTDNSDYNEAVTQAKRERFKVKRADGFEFWVEVTLPADWDGEPLPGIIWHYPSEYDDQEDYDEDTRDYNKNSFPGVYTRSPDIFVKRGYAVINADWPIAAERGGPNDGFVWSIVQNSTTVIDSVESRGYIDRDRMAIGGHSYGAFGAANAMVHTSFFKAGIAGDGNYNRTLTPMGFQREPRDLWRGQDRYLDMSPIFRADRIDGALLMYHGEEDQNVGTWPTHSRRMFHALNGMGKTAAMYMYPHEAHGPAAEETLLDLWTRWVNWMDHYVKDKGEHIPEKELEE